MKIGVAIFMVFALILMNILVWSRMGDYKWDRNPVLIGFVTLVTIMWIWIFFTYDGSSLVIVADRDQECAEQGGVFVKGSRGYVCVEAVNKDRP